MHPIPTSERPSPAIAAPASSPAPADAGQGMGTSPDCANAKRLRTLLFFQALLDVGYGVLLGVALSLAAFNYAMDVIARNAQAVLR